MDIIPRLEFVELCRAQSEARGKECMRTAAEGACLQRSGGTRLTLFIIIRFCYERVSGASRVYQSWYYGAPYELVCIKVPT